MADIAAKYGINSKDHGSATVSVFPDYKTKFGSYYSRLTQFEGWTDADFRKLNVFPAAYMNEMWERCAFGIGGQQLVSVFNILLPIGYWECNIDCVLPYGTVEGNGTFIAQPTNDSTQINMNNAGWLGKLKSHDNKPLRTIFVSPTYGQSTFVSSYHESGELRHVRLSGGAPQWLDPSYSSYGVYTFDAGETHNLFKIYAHNFNTAGFAFERGTPANANCLTAFNCNYTGIHFLGTALATLELAGSVDDCPDMFRMDPARGREAGGVLVFTINKKETGVTNEGRGAWKGTIIGYCQGQFSVTCLGVSNAAASVKVPCMFFVNPKLSDGTPQRCSIFVGASKGFNCQSFVHDAVNNKEWPAIPDYSGACLYYTSHYGGRCIVDMTEVMPSNPAPTDERLGFFKGPGTFNYATGQPAYSYTGGTTPVATWVPGTPVLGPCVNNSQTVTTPYVSSIPGQTPTTPKPADLVTTQACGTTPPPGTPQTINNATSATKVACTLPSVKSIKYSGLKINSAELATAFAGYLNDQVYCGFGGLYYGSNTLVQSVTSGTSTTVTITFPTPVALKNAVGIEAGTKLVPYTCTRITLTP